MALKGAGQSMTINSMICRTPPTVTKNLIDPREYVISPAKPIMVLIPLLVGTWYRPLFWRRRRKCCRPSFQYRLSLVVGVKDSYDEVNIQMSEEVSENISTTNILSKKICFTKGRCGENTFAKHRRKTRIRSSRNDRTRTRLSRYVATELKLSYALFQMSRGYGSQNSLM